MTETSSADDRHLAVRHLLPWYASARLDEGERAVVAAHLSGCASCRAELEEERGIAAMLAISTSFPSADGGWAAMAAKLDASERLAAPGRRDRRRWSAVGRRSRSADRLRWLAAAQLVVIVALGGWLVAGSPETQTDRQDAYRTLSAGAPQRAGNVLAMFRPGTTEAELRRLLTGSGARLVDGPTDAGAYVLAVPGGADGVALATLRRDAAVTMAEPIGPPLVEPGAQR